MAQKEAPEMGITTATTKIQAEIKETKMETTAEVAMEISETRIGIMTRTIEETTKTGKEIGSLMTRGMTNLIDIRIIEEDSKTEIEEDRIEGRILIDKVAINTNNNSERILFFVFLINYHLFQHFNHFYS
jgi:hypothetical protein